MAFEPKFYENGNLDIRCLKTGMVIYAEWGADNNKWIVVKDAIVSDSLSYDSDLFNIQDINDILEAGYISPIKKVYRGYYMTDAYSDEILWEKKKRELRVGDLVRLSKDCPFADRENDKNAYFIIGFKENVAQLLKINVKDRKHTLTSYDKDLLELVKGVDE
jgi:hypothetical protein